MSLDDLKTKVDDPTFFHVVGLFNPPRYGVRLFMTKLRYEHCGPDSFKVTIINWEGLDFVVASMPANAKTDAKQIAQQIGLEIEDGVPNVTSEKGEKWFPISSPYVFTLRANKQDSSLLKYEERLVAEIEQKYH